MKQYQLDRKRGAKMREGLENRRGGNSTVGSNPTPSARIPYFQWVLRRPPAAHRAHRERTEAVRLGTKDGTIRSGGVLAKIRHAFAIGAP